MLSRKNFPKYSKSFGETLCTWAMLLSPLAGLKNVVTVTVPAGMKYVASKNGKYYYPVESVAGEKIVPANRVYFASEGDAEAAGFAAGR
jgi:hypothetical protein